MRTRGPGHDETKQRILDAARRLVAKRGHESLSLREVARAVRLSPASLYEYFDSRAAIVDALARDALVSLGGALSRPSRHTKSARAVLVDIGLAYVAWAKENREDFLLLFQALPSKRTSLQQRTPDGSPYRIVLDAIRRLHPRMADEMLEAHAYGFWAAAHGMAMLQLTHLSGFDADFHEADRAVLESLTSR